MLHEQELCHVHAWEKEVLVCLFVSKTTLHPPAMREGWLLLFKQHFERSGGGGAVVEAGGVVVTVVVGVAAQEAPPSDTLIFSNH